MTEFMRPQVTVEEIDTRTARYIVEPLERGYGYTLGNSMRRVLLSSLEGAAATSIRIEGVRHEFSTIAGIREDVTDVVLNVKGLVFSETGTEIVGAGETVTNPDISKVQRIVRILFPENAHSRNNRCHRIAPAGDIGEFHRLFARGPVNLGWGPDRNACPPTGQQVNAPVPCVDQRLYIERSCQHGAAISAVPLVAQRRAAFIDDGLPTRNAVRVNAEILSRIA